MYILPQQQRQLTACRFSIVELMMSMAVLSIMLLLLFRYINVTQRTWQLNEGQQEMVEAKRIALDIIERDLNSAVTSSLLNQQIGFHIPDPNTDDFAVAFIASIPLNSGPSRLCEIYYKQEGDRLLRMIVPSTSPNWDFFGETTTGRPAWIVGNEVDNTYETILYGGVAAFNMSFFIRGNDATPIAPGSTLYDLPQRADIELLLYDNNVPNPTPANIALTQRSFISILYLNKLIPR